MAVVYLGHDPSFRRDVAIKVLPRETMEDPTVYARFQSEARVIGSLEHPAIVPVYDYGEENGQPFLVMRYLNGGSLASRIKAGPLPIPETAKVLVRIGSALEAAHEKGIVHRDLKPANILFDQYGEAYLSDFGIAKLSEATTTLTGSSILGTPAYMSPEQITGEGKVDGRSDIYALGILLFEMLTGSRPFKADTPSQMMMMHLAARTPRIPEERTDIPDGVNLVLGRAMDKNPGSRFQKASELVSAFSVVTTGGKPSSGSDPQTGKAAPEAATYVYPESGRILPSHKRLMDHGRKAEDRNRKPSRKIWALIGISAVLIPSLIFLAVRSLAPGTPAVVGGKASQTPSLFIGNPLTSTPTVTLVHSRTPFPTPPRVANPGDIWVSPADGMNLVFIPAGEFLMGFNEGDPAAPADAKPQRKITLNGYWMDRLEVTNEMFAAFVEATGYITDSETKGESLVFDEKVLDWVSVPGAYWRDPRGDGKGISDLQTHPVVQVSWTDAVSYCGWAGRRLPSEAEWEKAARGTDGRKYPWGNNPLNGKRANFADRQIGILSYANLSVDDGYKYTAPAGSYPDGASPYGLLDMAGNVHEWVSDWYSDKYYSEMAEANPQGPSDGEKRVFRGGAWLYGATALQSAYRNKGSPLGGRNGAIGFRCAA
jgi:formylglycine-generating enzyme required for sulfatase activity